MGLAKTGLNSDVVLILGGLNSEILLYFTYAMRKGMLDKLSVVFLFQLTIFKSRQIESIIGRRADREISTQG